MRTQRATWLQFVLCFGLAAGCLGSAPAPQRTTAITSCETFRAWFARQPGGTMVSALPQDSQSGTRPAAFDTILTYRWNTMHPADPAFKRMRSYTTGVGSGGCMAGYYDPSASRALVFLVYGTATDLVITRTTSVPGGLPVHPVPSGTKAGAKLGMSLASVQRIEGPGKLYRKNGVAVLFYNQSAGDAHGGTLYGHLAFLLIDGAVAAIVVGGGH
ncbi:MAG TPA: hypothetical protein VJP76_04420 [Candidatus Tumulicola sp.]|nr:hypothetical protein [Candidatus Tumulicola sp.]